MSYVPMTPAEAAKLSLRPEGVYAFDVLTAEAKVSKKGAPMIALQLGLYDEDGARFSVKDWLVHSESRWAEKKFYDFAESTGLGQKYAAGTLCAEDCLGRSGLAAVGVEKGKPKGDGSGNFPDRNNVKYYTTKKPAAKTPAPGTKATGTDEDVPF